ncbi:hypothetical protein OUZ56_028896 [Daphnia magna]|uniref:Uncharacterized protein n=1 Tax=Daphnia magna TaxID=35525 RepID=A0ABR0B586_9CRUS|nr:hypothetical protein OUZ56_028896 [Daphnia magna]
MATIHDATSCAIHDRKLLLRVNTREENEGDTPDATGCNDGVNSPNPEEEEEKEGKWKLLKE